MRLPNKRIQMEKNPNTNTRKKLTNSTGEQGFTLVELIIAMLIFLIVTGSIYGMLQVAQRSRSIVNQQTQLNKNVRFALNLLGRDTYNAGFGYPLKSSVILPNNRISPLLGIPNDSDATRDTLPPIIAGNNITLNTFTGAGGALTDQVTFLFKDPSFNLTGAPGQEVSQSLNINAATTTSGIDEIVPVTGSNSVCRVNDIYLITGNTGSTIGLATGLNGTDKVQFANADVLGFNQTGAGNPLRSITTPATMLRVRMVTYFVSADGTLMRREYANTTPVTPAVAFVDEPLVYGVENFQIQYVMDDGSISNNPSAGPNGVPGDADDKQSELEAIRQIRFTVTVATTDVNQSGSETAVWHCANDSFRSDDFRPLQIPARNSCTHSMSSNLYDHDPRNEKFPHKAIGHNSLFCRFCQSLQRLRYLSGLLYLVT